MENILIVVIALGLVAVAFILLQRNTQSQTQTQFRLFQDSLESFQRNLLLQQTESERTLNASNTALRGELAQELMNSRKELHTGLLQATHSLEQKVTGIDLRLDQRMKEMTHGVQQKLEANLKEGFVHFEKVQHHLKQAEFQLQNLNQVGQSINDLNNLLKLPHLRGSFGEATLERILTDLLPGDLFELQYRVVPTSTERVDAVIKYPNRVLPVDSKFPREQVLPLFETSDPAKLEQARKDLYDVMRNLAKQIKEKYIHPEHGTTEMALLFVPSETLYFEMLRNPKLLEELAKHKVYAASPNTLAVTLQAIASAKQYYDMAKGVEKTIGEIKKTQQHFEHFGKKFDDVGVAIAKANSAFNTASTHLSRFSGAVTRLTGTETQTGLLSPEPT